MRILPVGIHLSDSSSEETIMYTHRASHLPAGIPAPQLPVGYHLIVSALIRGTTPFKANKYATDMLS